MRYLLRRKDDLHNAMIYIFNYPAPNENRYLIFDLLSKYACPMHSKNTHSLEVVLAHVLSHMLTVICVVL